MNKIKKFFKDFFENKNGLLEYLLKKKAITLVIVVIIALIGALTSTKK